MTNKPLRVAVIGAGPAGIYASDILSKSGLKVSIDLFEKLPAPYGLVRYGVAPDHPRIKQIIVALYNILQRGDIRLFGNVEVGKDITLEKLQEHYDAVIAATGADSDRDIDIPGINLQGSFGGSAFVYWYDGHPDVPRTWPITAKEVAVIGVGNVALDIARILAKQPDDLLSTELPENVEEGLRKSPVTDIHVFGRRGPAQVKFTPLELRELGKQPEVDVIVYDDDFQFDEGSEKAMKDSKQTAQVVKTLLDFSARDTTQMTGKRRIHLHILHNPVSLIDDGTGHVAGIRTERTEITGDGNVRPTGEFVDTPVQAVYRAVGYASSPVPGFPFDQANLVIPNVAGRVLEEAGSTVTVPGLYATGWVKRGPVGLIGSTKSDAQETITALAEDAQAGILSGTGDTHEQAIVDFLDENKIRYTTWHGWEILDAYEQELGEQRGRERYKVVERETMTAVSRGEEHIGKLW